MGNELTHVKDINAITEISKAAQQIQALFMMGYNFPRKPQVSEENMLNACQDIELAKKGLYDFSKGGNRIYGLSVVAMEEIAVAWGRLKWGFEILESDIVDKHQSTVYAYCLDYQSGSLEDRKFIVHHYYVGTTKLVTDQNDVYSVVANYAQRRLRTCIEKMLPYALRQKCIKQLEKTLMSADKDPQEMQIAKIKDYMFKQFNVTVDQIEKRYQCKISALTPVKIANLRIVAESLNAGTGKIEDFFGVNIVDAEVINERSNEQKASSSEVTPNEQGEKKRTRGPNKPKPEATVVEQVQQISDAEAKNLPPDGTIDEAAIAEAEEHERAMQAATEAAESAAEADQMELNFG